MKYYKIREETLKTVIFIVKSSDGVTPPLKRGLLNELRRLEESTDV